ncbi:proton channel OtopLc-like [Rhodnius prolixus]|uniref:proton channel OtopLc-like n=1 Tax=Rhodnius prolixus TaxID=13249 RepID=UPI003D18A2D6
MVLHLKPQKEGEEVIQVDNFYLGPPDFNKFSPLQVSSFPARKICLLNDQLVDQVPGLPSASQYGGSALLRGVAGSSWPGSLAGHAATCVAPTSSTEKEHMFRQSLTTISSCIYGVFIVTLGVIVYIGELMSGKTPVAECFSIYLVLVGLTYFSFLYLDLRKYLRILKISEEMALRRYDLPENTAENDTEAREQISNVEWSSLPEPDLVLPHYYCFTRGRHSGSFYMKVGAAGFCLGHLIHSGLLISYQLAFLMTDSANFLRCASIATLVLDLLYPTYSFLQLFFIFKYSNVIINRFKVAGRFALMHCIGSNLCFWIWTILRETVDSLYHGEDAPVSLHHLNSHKAMYMTGLENSTEYTSSALILKKCHGPMQFKIVFETFSPYLYPFTIEYSILVVGVLFIMWQNIGTHKHCRNDDWNSGDLMSNVVLYADCHSSNKGLFAGLIVLAGSFLSIILFFVAMADSKYLDVGLSVNSCTELTLIVLMSLTVVPLYSQITKLDVNRKAVSLLDDLLLFICIPAFFVQTILIITPAWYAENYVGLVTTVLQTVQVLIQTPFISDGLRRCSNTKSLRVQKPGRELLTFLIVLNVTMWITETFEIKSHTAMDGDPSSRYYGQFLWAVVTHLTFPLTMFYRFHSSVCMVDIWKSAYVRG